MYGMNFEAMVPKTQNNQSQISQRTPPQLKEPPFKLIGLLSDLM